MELKLIAVDPESGDGKSPTIWDAGDDYILQGWDAELADIVRQIGETPAGENRIKFPKRMLKFFPEANGGSQP